jgi:hypothetical protein
MKVKNENLEDRGWQMADGKSEGGEHGRSRMEDGRKADTGYVEIRSWEGAN